MFKYTHHFNCDLSLEEVNVLGEVECVLATVAYHVRIEHIIRALEDLGEVRLVGGTLQRTLQHPHQHIDDLLGHNTHTRSN